MGISALSPWIPFALLMMMCREVEKSWRESVLAAAVLWGLLLTIITEGLSAVGSLSFRMVLVSWLASGAMLAMAVPWSSSKSRLLSLNAKAATAPLRFLLPIAFIASITGFIAFIAAPNNYDSMTYHLSRVVHWIQSQSVQHYPTEIDRQLYMPPWAEFAVTNFYILSGGDYLANCVQWLSMLGSLVGVSLIAKQLGADNDTQWLAALVAACLPMGILQASSTQTDYVVTFWLVCFVHYALRLIRMSDRQPLQLRDAALAGMGLGLAFLTKPTAYLLAIPFLGWLVFSLVRTRALESVKVLLLISSLALIINLGHYARNLEVFQSPMGPEAARMNVTNASLDHAFPSLVLSNIVRNAAGEMATPFSYGNRIVEVVVDKSERILGLRQEGKNFIMPYPQSHEDAAGNPLHFALLILCLAALIATAKRDGISMMHYYVIAGCVAFVLLCSYLRWNVWITRIHLPLLVLCSTAIAVTLSRPAFARIRPFIIVLLLVGTLPALFNNESRTILGNAHGPRSMLGVPRIEQYFRNRQDLYAPYTRAADVVKGMGCSKIGLWMQGRNHYEYPLWILLDGAADHPRLQYVRVSNQSAGASAGGSADHFVPCAVLALSESELPSRIIEADRRYAKVWNTTNTIVTTVPKVEEKRTTVAVYELEAPAPRQADDKLQDQFSGGPFQTAPAGSREQRVTRIAA